MTFYSRKANYTSSGFLTSLMLDGTTVSTFNPDADGTGGVNSITNGGNRMSHALSTHATADVSFSNATLNGTFRRQYNYEQAGRIGQRMTGKGTSYQYDGLGRLTHADTFSNCSWGGLWPADTVNGPYAFCDPLSGVNEYNTYSYDPMGNRTDKGGIPTTGNRYSWFKNSIYYYDADGNVIQKYNNGGLFNRQWYWNPRGQLDTAMKDSWFLAAFEYDALGRPVRISEGDVNSGTHISRYLLWVGDALLAEFWPNGQRDIDYIYLPGDIDNPFASTEGLTTPTAVRYQEVDELGNVLGTHTNGAVTQSNTYDAWGVYSSTNAESHLYWKGLFWDGDNIGLFYMRNRWYDPEGGRFVSEDPAGFRGGPNLYVFSDNDPINGSDPSGLCRKIGGFGLYWHFGKDCYKKLVQPWALPGGYSYGKIGGPPPTPDAATLACSEEYQSELQADLALTGLGIVPFPKRFVTPGLSPVSSVASTVLRRLLPFRWPSRQWAPTFIRPAARSMKVGGTLGRWTPMLGFGLFLEDVAAMGECAGYLRQAASGAGH